MFGWFEYVPFWTTARFGSQLRQFCQGPLLTVREPCLASTEGAAKARNDDGRDICIAAVGFLIKFWEASLLIVLGCFPFWLSFDSRLPCFGFKILLPAPSVKPSEVPTMDGRLRTPMPQRLLKEGDPVLFCVRPSQGHDGESQEGRPFLSLRAL